VLRCHLENYKKNLNYNRNSISQARLNVLVTRAIENKKQQMWTLKKLSVTFQTQITEEEFQHQKPK
jgi:hypothetical protein